MYTHTAFTWIECTTLSLTIRLFSRAAGGEGGGGGFALRTQQAHNLCLTIHTLCTTNTAEVYSAELVRAGQNPHILTQVLFCTDLFSRACEGWAKSPHTHTGAILHHSYFILYQHSIDLLSRAACEGHTTVIELHHTYISSQHSKYYLCIAHPSGPGSVKGWLWRGCNGYCSNRDCPDEVGSEVINTHAFKPTLVCTSYQKQGHWFTKPDLPAHNCLPNLLQAQGNHGWFGPHQKNDKLLNVPTGTCSRSDLFTPDWNESDSQGHRADECHASQSWIGALKSTVCRITEDIRYSVSKRLQ